LKLLVHSPADVGLISIAAESTRRSRSSRRAITEEQYDGRTDLSRPLNRWPPRSFLRSAWNSLSRGTEELRHSKLSVHHEAASATHNSQYAFTVRRVDPVRIARLGFSKRGSSLALTEWANVDQCSQRDSWG